MREAVFVVRPLEDKDILQATDILVSAYRHGEWNEHWKGERATLRIQQIRQSPGSVCLCCASGDELAGIILGRLEIRVDENYFIIDELAVAPRFQRRGLGQKLVQELEDRIALEGYTGVFLLTLKEGFAADFYRKNGYSLGPRMGFFRKDELVAR
jgi:ribosomal protein S18 acetylase RimI-like enzyme